VSLYGGKDGKEPGVPKRKKVPRDKRKICMDCESNDIVEFEDGRRAVVTGWWNNGPGGRYLDENGEPGPLVALPTMARIRLVN